MSEAISEYAMDAAARAMIEEGCGRPCDERPECLCYKQTRIAVETYLKVVANVEWRPMSTAPDYVQRSRFFSDHVCSDGTKEVSEMIAGIWKPDIDPNYEVRVLGRIAVAWRPV